MNAANGDQNALNNLQQEVAAASATLEENKLQESAIQQRLQSYEQQASEAEKILHEDSAIPEASMFSFKPALEKAQHIIERQKKALAVKDIIAAKNEKLQAEVSGLSAKVERLEKDKAEEKERSFAGLKKWMSESEKLSAQLDEMHRFLRWNPEADKMFLDYRYERQQEVQQKAAAEKQRQQEAEQHEKQQQEEKTRQAKEQESQKAQEAERQKQEREANKVQQQERRPRGMGMGR